ncbi:MAG: flagellin [Actinomycetota bacterium]|nr:flagellin [Actinomycetota bacterium]
MSLRINQNISAIIANRNLRITNDQRSKSLEKLSSGLRINKAADDAAGLGISEKIRAQIGGLNQAGKNAQDGISLIQTAEGALQEASSILVRIRELAVQAANGSITDADRQNISAEVTQLVTEIDRIAQTTEFNTKALLAGVDVAAAFTLNPTSTVAVGATLVDATSVVNATYTVSIASSSASFDWSISNGSTVVASGSDATTDVIATVDGLRFTITAASVEDGDTLATVVATAAHVTAQAFSFHIGANANQTTAFSINPMDTRSLGINVIDVSTVDGANTALGLVDTAITAVSSQRSTLGAAQNRLEHTINNLSVASENLAASESRIRDVDMAYEMTNYTKNQIMLQAGIAMLAQANVSPQMVLQLLQ